MKCIPTLKTFKELFSRAIFLAHAVISVYLVQKSIDKPLYWICSIPAFLLIAETYFFLVIRQGHEFRYWWPSGLLYIMTMIPIIWVIELELLQERLDLKNKQRTRQTSDMGHPWLALMTTEMIGKKVCEIGIILGLIIGRWLMPRGSMTRDQLSVMLLAYVGNAADIFDLFDTLEEPSIVYRKDITITVLAVYTWSILQFALVATATNKVEPAGDQEMSFQDKKPNPDDGQLSRFTILEDEITQSKQIIAAASVPPSVSNKYHNKVPVNDESMRVKEAFYPSVKPHKIEGELLQTLVTLLMQDGPFLVLRLYLSIEFGVSSELHIFFICKNVIVSVLLVYRLCVLCKGKNTYKIQQ